MPSRLKTTTKRDIHINTTKTRAQTAKVDSGGKPKERLPLTPPTEIKMVLFFALGMVRVQKLTDPNSNTPSAGRLKSRATEVLLKSTTTTTINTVK
jgi:hypothetical protein